MVFTERQGKEPRSAGLPKRDRAEPQPGKSQLIRSAIAVVAILFLPLVAAGLATGIGVLAYNLAATTLLQSALIGIGAFCALMTLAVYGWLVRHVRSVKRQMNEFNTFEDNIISRLQGMESRGTQMEKGLVRRLDDIEERLDAAKPGGVAAAPQNAMSTNSRAEFDPSLAGKDGNVVALNPAAKPLASGGADSGAGERRKSRSPSVQPSLGENMLSVRLQPILNLIDREVIGLEAFAFFKSGEDLIDGRNLIDRLTKTQRSQYDLWVVTALSSIVREMHSDGQSVPIHYSLVSLNAPTDANWVKLSQILKSDAKLVENLVPVIPQNDFLSMSEKTREKLFDLREAGLDCCLGRVSDLNGTLDKETLRHFRQFKINAATLLNYRANERERFADRLLPELQKAEASIFVDEISEAFQASQLIDLDLVAGQGDYISKPRPIRLYKQIEDDPLTKIADGTSDQPSK